MTAPVPDPDEGWLDRVVISDGTPQRETDVAGLSAQDEYASGLRAAKEVNRR